MMVLTLAQQAAADTSNEMYLLWGFVLLGIAIVLLFLEFLIPSGGLIAVLCVFYMYDKWWGIGAALAYVFLTPFILVFFFKLWLSSPIGKRMILGGSEEETHLDPEEASLASEQARQQRLAELKQLVGAEGVTETALRPVGTVRIDNQRVDAMAESGVIDADTPIVVTDVYDNQIKVRPR